MWQDTLAHPGVTVFVSEASGRIAATCMLVTAPNLLREGRRHGFLENVVTHPAIRGRGHGRAVVQAALTHAWASGCHHVLMQSGRTDPKVHAFSQALGFVPGRRTAYVAARPGRSDRVTAVPWTTSRSRRNRDVPQCLFCCIAFDEPASPSSDNAFSRRALACQCTSAEALVCRRFLPPNR
ncbi:GNAT family N-acetyltransferase [Methylobacterium aquaticum]|uniref:GNAT family N-acetyltransferase n=1 Tax=Methylobacterium aquaticum TaxID=270351 RepID=UPI003D163DC7